MLLTIRADLQPVAKAIKQHLNPGTETTFNVADRYGENDLPNRIVNLKGISPDIHPTLLAKQTIGHGSNNEELTYKFALEPKQQSKDPGLSGLPQGGFVSGVYNTEKGEFVRVTEKTRGVKRDSAFKILEYAFEECLIAFQKTFFKK